MEATDFLPPQNMHHTAEAYNTPWGSPFAESNSYVINTLQYTCVNPVPQYDLRVKEAHKAS